MASENESTESIVAEMRGPNSKTIRRMSQRLRNGEWRDDFRAALKDYADRIDAAWKRERVEVRMTAATTILKERVPVPAGNAKEMRKALCRIKGMAKSWEFPGGDAATILGLIIDRASDAIAEPPRNCDVGTAKEQAERFRRHCDKFTRDGMHETCPCCGKIPFAGCEFAWEQMPYEAQEGGAQ